MNATQEKAISHLIGYTQSPEESLESWQKLADTHPYFIPAQFFLSYGLKQRSHAAAAAQIVKTSLYFSNTHWLQYQLYVEPVRKKPNKGNDAFYLSDTVGQGVREDMGDEHALSAEHITALAAKTAGEPAAESKISSILSNQLADFKKPVADSDKLDIDAIREQMHTVDYFASQGIKIDLSKIPQDKLTTHLRKFTDWLKQMKNPEPSQDLGTSQEMENAVMEIAKSSNISREVLTEAMAEVLAKQGQVEKAIQLLIKLSFINPEKSSYFAARIEQLKGII